VTQEGSPKTTIVGSAPLPHSSRNPAWKARTLGSKFQLQVFYTLIRLGGRYAAYALLLFVVAWYVLFLPSVRKRAGFYLRRRFPDRSGPLRLLDCYRLCLGLGKSLVDRAVLGILGSHRLKYSLEGRDKLKALLAEGRGLVLVTAHAGSWQVGMTSLAALDAPITILIHREEGDADRHLFEHSEGPNPYRIIDPLGYLGGTLEMFQVLKRGEVLSIMGDRVLGGEGSQVSVKFLGGTVSVPFSPYRLASVSGAPVAVIFPHMTDHEHSCLRLARVIRIPEGLGRDAEAYRPYAQEFALALEEFVQDHPFEFFNFFDMWTESPSRPDPSL